MCIFTDSVNRLVFGIEADCVLFEVRNESGKYQDSTLN